MTYNRNGADSGTVTTKKHGSDSESDSDNVATDLEYYRCPLCFHNVPVGNLNIHTLGCPGVCGGTTLENGEEKISSSDVEPDLNSNEETEVKQEAESDSETEVNGQTQTRPRIQRAPRGQGQTQPRIPAGQGNTQPRANNGTNNETGARVGIDVDDCSDSSDDVIFESVRIGAGGKGKAKARNTNTNLIDLISSDEEGKQPRSGAETGHGIRKRRSSESGHSTSSGSSIANAMHCNTRSNDKGKDKVDESGPNSEGGRRSGIDFDGRHSSSTHTRGGSSSRQSSSQNSNRSAQVEHSQGANSTGNTKQPSNRRTSARGNSVDVDMDVEMNASDTDCIDVDAVDNDSLSDWQMVRDRFRRTSLAHGEDLIMGPTFTPPTRRRSGTTSDDEVVVMSAVDVDSAQRADEGWSCPRCSFQNHAHIPVCEMCFLERSVADANGNGMRRVRRRRDNQGRPNLAQKQQKQKWTCTQCTYENSATDTRCEMCRTSRPGTRDIGADSYGAEGDDSGRSAFSGALLGMVGGAALAYMTGRSVAPSMMRGAMTGALTGSAASAATHSQQQQLRQQHQRSLLQHQQMHQQQQAMIRGPNQANRMPGTRLVFVPRGQNGQRVTQVPVVSHFNPSDVIDNMNYEELMQRFPPQVGRAANRWLIHALPTETLSKAAIAKLEEGSQNCCICLEDFKAGEKMKRLPCLHTYHDHCIDEWLSRRGTCPVCKHALE